MVGGVDDQVEWTCIAGCHCFISSFFFQGHQSHPDNQENNNGFCLELLADVAVFSTLIHNLKIGFCYLGSMLVYFFFGFFLFWQKKCMSNWVSKLMAGQRFARKWGNHWFCLCIPQTSTHRKVVTISTSWLFALAFCCHQPNISDDD